jgi:hypothetical protein
MFKKIDELNRNEKIDLLKLIASGEIGRGDIDCETVFVTDPKDCFVAMLSEGKEDEYNTVYIGEARTEAKKMNDWAKDILEKYPPGVHV